MSESLRRASERLIERLTTEDTELIHVSSALIMIRWIRSHRASVDESGYEFSWIDERS